MSNAEIEQALVSGQHRGLLEDYFGAEQYAELRELARQATRATRGGQSVLILPGIMGSELGYPPPPDLDVIWLSYLKIFFGRLGELRLPAKPGAKIGAVGVLLFAYEKLKLRLRAAGFDADFYPYDWRLDLNGLGAGLASAIEKKGAPVHLVAHSMGGLVARAACKTRPKNLKRIVTLGTPNYGSFAPIQAFRGVHATISKVEWLDQAHDAEDLARIFRNFPGLCQMIPSPAHSSVDYYRLESWPNSKVRPEQVMLDAARAVQGGLPEDCNDLVQIIGCNRETVTGARIVRDEFEYQITNAGDGTVPLALARLPKSDAYFIEEEHGSLPNNKTVAGAVAEILSTGKTAALRKEPPAAARSLGRSVTDTDLLRASKNQKAVRNLSGAGGDDLDADVSATAAKAAGKGAIPMPSSRELRNLVSEFASPRASDNTLPLEGAVATITDPGRAEHVVVGRRAHHRLDITVVHGSLFDVDSEAYVLGLFSQVSPTGPAAQLDAIMKGAVSQMMDRRMFDGNVGEITILPKGRHPLRPDFIAFAGLGSFDTFKEETLGLVAENLVRTFVASRVDDFATVAIGGGSGMLTLASLTHILTGFLRGLVETDHDHNFRRITICEIDASRFQMIRDELYRLCATTLFDNVEVTLRERRIPIPPAVVSSQEVRAAGTRGDTTYLSVRQEDLGQNVRFHCSVLSSGHGATVVTETTEPISTKTLDALLDELPQGNTNKLTRNELARIGRQLGDLALPVPVRHALIEAEPQHLVVIHDTAASRIPWDAVYIKDKVSLGGTRRLSHRYEAAGLSIAKWLHKRNPGERVNVLLAVNPTQDLDGAGEEGARIEQLLKDLTKLAAYDKIEGDEVTRGELLRRLKSGTYDVLHYSGHSFFNPAQPENSGLKLANGEVLTGADLAPLNNLPSLVFFNSCQSARIRGQSLRAKLPVGEGFRRGHGVAEALLRGGIANFIGTYWPVRDDAAKDFATAFYTPLLSGDAIGDAFQAARRAVMARRDNQAADWADYAFYGIEDFRLRL